MPYTIRNDPRFVSAEPFVFCVGAVQRTTAVPPFQLQVSVKLALALMLGKVCVPDAALSPDQPPLARQLCATGFVDHVSTGVRLPVAYVWLARSETTPAVCACTPAAERARAMKTSFLESMSDPFEMKTNKRRAEWRLTFLRHTGFGAFSHKCPRAFWRGAATRPDANGERRLGIQTSHAGIRR